MSPARGGALENREVGAEADISEKEGRGTWRHAAFHVATTIATPAAYAPLPFAVASLGWPRGVFSLVIGTLVTWCSSLVLASLWQWNGEKHTTYQLLAKSIFGRWGYWYVIFFQQVASVGNNIALQIAAGSSLKALYKLYYTADNRVMTLQQFILLFGAFELFLSQLPDIHSLRWVNAICSVSTIGFAGTSIGVTIYDGHWIDRNEVDYSLQGNTATKVFRAFNALCTIAFSFGDAVLPEIQWVLSFSKSFGEVQSTVREPVRVNMYKSISAAYTIIVMSYWALAFSGYWAFGSQVQPYILSSLTAPRPTFAHFEERVKEKNVSRKSRIWRLIYTSTYMTVITLVSMAMPFFGDLVSICGAVSFTPLDFVLPSLAFAKTRKTPQNLGLQCAVKVLCYAVAILFSIVGALACIGAIRSIVLDVKTYRSSMTCDDIFAATDWRLCNFK